MDRRGQMWMTLLDEEYELAPVTAMELLIAKGEARSALAGAGVAQEELDEAIIYGAAMLSLGARLKGERAFESPKQVLELLTAEEITSAAELYGYSESAAPQSRLTATGAGNGVEAQKYTAEYAGHEPYEGGEDALSSAAQDTAHVFERANAGVDVYGSLFEGNRTGGAPTGGAGYRSMEEISGFFERDSRRYDALIGIL